MSAATPPGRMRRAGPGQRGLRRGAARPGPLRRGALDCGLCSCDKATRGAGIMANHGQFVRRWTTVCRHPKSNSTWRTPRPPIPWAKRWRAAFLARCAAARCCTCAASSVRGKPAAPAAYCAPLGCGGLIRSPTFTLLESYRLGAVNCIHVDLYRLHSPVEVDELGLRDHLNPGCLLLIEWPEKGGGRAARRRSRTDPRVCAQRTSGHGYSARTALGDQMARSPSAEH